MRRPIGNAGRRVLPLEVVGVPAERQLLVPELAQPVHAGRLRCPDEIGVVPVVNDQSAIVVRVSVHRSQLRAILGPRVDEPWLAGGELVRVSDRVRLLGKLVRVDERRVRRVGADHGVVLRRHRFALADLVPAAIGALVAEADIGPGQPVVGIVVGALRVVNDQLAAADDEVGQRGLLVLGQCQGVDLYQHHRVELRKVGGVKLGERQVGEAELVEGVAGHPDYRARRRHRVRARRLARRVRDQGHVRAVRGPLATPSPAAATAAPACGGRGHRDRGERHRQ